MINKLDNLTNDVVNKIDNYLLEDYKKIYNYLKKKTIEKQIHDFYDEIDPYNLSFSNKYEEIIGVYAKDFKLSFNTNK